MADLNDVKLIGNLGDDPKVTTFDNGDKQAVISIATNKYRKDKKTGETKQTTQWHRVVVKGQAGAYIAEYAKKGHTVFVDGELESRSYQDDKGETQYLTEVVTFVAQILSAKPADKKK